MTEAEWLACREPRPMLLFLASGASERKARLCAVACCYRDSATMSDDLAHRLVLTAEAYADCLLDASALRSATSYEADECPALAAAFPSIQGHDFVHQTARAADLVCWWRADPVGNQRETPAFFEKVAVERAEIATLVCDIFGNPFRPAAFDPSWRTDTALTLAQQMYDSRDFGAMPILADALQDAGCEVADILNHCRDASQPHVRGCWVVDLVLGKE